MQIIRKLIPPKLDDAHIGQKIICYRPMRDGSPNMSVEIIGSKIVTHNYGHGGSGWTLAPGFASYTNDLLINSSYAEELNTETPITIIGAGVIGLFSAYDLEQKGFKNITIIADKFNFLTSHNAGALLAPVSMNNDSTIQNLIDKIGIETYKFYKSIATHTHPNFQEGAKIVPAYFTHRADSGLEPYVGKVLEPAKDVIVDFQNGTTHKMVVYDDGIFINTSIMMNSLTHYLKPKITFIKRTINDFEEIESKYIINCTGLEAKNLCNDDKLISVQGHLIMLKDQNPEDLQYMILTYLGNEINKFKQKTERAFYILPKNIPGSNHRDIGVIGGSFIEGANKKTPNHQEFNLIIENAKKFYGIN